MRLRWLAVIGLAAAVGLGGCSKKEEPASEAAKPQAPSAQPEMPASHPATGEQGEGTMGATPPAAPRQVVVPEDVKNTWKAVVLEVTNKETGKKEDVTIDIGQSATVEGLKIEVENFLPSFSMSAGEITSRSNETENPAVQLSVSQDGTQVFSGWLFSLYPDAHPFQSDKFGLLLKDFVKK